MAAGDEDLQTAVEGRLRHIGQRYTSGRRAIVEFLASTGHPVPIGDIADALPEVPRSSAYRHLVDLESAGVVRRLAANDDFARFELAEELTEHHHHLLCLGCGDVTDITPSSSFERVVAGHLDALATAEGFRPQSHRVDVLGLCANCQ